MSRTPNEKSANAISNDIAPIEDQVRDIIAKNPDQRAMWLNALHALGNARGFARSMQNELDWAPSECLAAEGMRTTGRRRPNA